MADEGAPPAAEGETPPAQVEEEAPARVLTDDFYYDELEQRKQALLPRITPHLCVRVPSLGPEAHLDTPVRRGLRGRFGCA